MNTKRIILLLALALPLRAFAETSEGTWEGMLVSVYGYSSYMRLHLDAKGGYILQAGERLGPEINKFDTDAVTYTDGIYKIQIKKPIKDRPGYYEKILIFTIENNEDEWMPSYVKGSLFSYWSGENKRRRTEAVHSYDLAEIKKKSLVERINEGLAELKRNANQ